MTLAPSAAAVASTGSVPPDVSAFAADDDGLLLELEEFFGVDQRGTGLDFRDGIELGEIDRVFLWSNDFHSGVPTDTPVQYVNRWKVPVLIGEEPVGVALIGFDPATVEPEMIDFIRSPGTALALDDVDNDATLVHEPETGAWFALIDDELTPLVRGSSDVAGDTTLAAYQPIVATRSIEVVEETPQPDQGSVQSVVLIVATIGVVLLALLIPTVLGKVRERRERRAGDAVAADSDVADTDTDTDIEPIDGEAHADASPDALAPLTADAGDPVSPSNDTKLADADTDTDADTDADAGADAGINAEESPAAVPPVPTAAKRPSRSSSSSAKTSKSAPAKTGTSRKAPAAKAPASKTAPAKKSASKSTAAQSTAAKIPARKAPAGTANTAAAKKSPAVASDSQSRASTSTAAKKPAAKKPAAKKPAAKTAAPKATTAKSSAAEKPDAKTPAAKKPAPKTAAPKTAAPKTTAPKTTAPKTTAAKRPATAKSATAKPAAKAPAAKKPAAKKPAAKKPATKTPSSPAAGATDDSAPQ
ncbi:hypothetical protein [Salinibacterium amurskyense]|nr:hypothetical protein [Salinibacterium amurskyense]RLQ80534.1 hypothetical protein D9C83_09960 [Salinibacterium amurskyense]GHD83239.1 hypothetical protein GCM10007394_22360 [Salinibacterium amurskyense]